MHNILLKLNLKLLAVKWRFLCDNVQEKLYKIVKYSLINSRKCYTSAGRCAVAHIDIHVTHHAGICSWFYWTIKLTDPGLAGYVSAIYIYIGDIYGLLYIQYFWVQKYRRFSIFSTLDIFHIFQHYFIIDVKTSIKCENGHFKFSVLFTI